MTESGRVEVNDGQDFLVWRQGMGYTVEILDIHVCGERRRQGYGKRLLDLLLRDIPPDTKLLFAITRVSNTIAQEFYEAMGFRIVGRLHKFYKESKGSGEHALMYGKDI